MLANCTCVDLSTKVHVPENTIDRWLDQSQQESINEVMVEICDENIATNEAHNDKAKSGTTPRSSSLGDHVGIRNWCIGVIRCSYK